MSNQRNSYNDVSTGNGEDEVTDQFLNDVRKTDKSRGQHGSKRPESIREHASNYRTSVGYISKMKYGEGPRDDTDDSEDEQNTRSVRDSHYNRKSNKE